MKKLSAYLFLILCFVHPLASAHLSDELAALLTPYPHVNVGIHVVALENTNVLFEHNAQQSFVPASNTKLFTAAAALWHLGKDFHFYTSALIATNTNITNKTLQGDLYIKFSGDPNLSLVDINQLIEKLTRKFNHIAGNVYLDISNYDNNYYAPGSTWDDQLSCVAGAPVSAVIINRNCFQQTFKDEITYYVNHEPEEYALTVIQQLLSTQITLNGSVLFGIIPKDNKILLQTQSPPLSQLLSPILKNSNNLFADTIFKKIGEDYFQRQGSWLLGQKAVKEILDNNNFHTDQSLILYDGSGVSRYNLATPEQITQLLTVVYYDTNISKEFLAALPKGGEEGTLSYRLGNINTKAKTGTLTHVSSLSGYLLDNNQAKLAYAIMINGFIEERSKYRQLEDALVQLIQHHLLD